MDTEGDTEGDTALPLSVCICVGSESGLLYGLIV